MRFKFVCLLSAAALSFAATQAVSAADLPSRPDYNAPLKRPAFNWTGFYLGAHIGGGWGHSKWIGADPGFVGSEDADMNPSGFIGGGQVGYNWQLANHIVLGVEGDFSGSTMDESVAGCFADPAQTCSTKTDWTATATGRLGYAFDRNLIYVKGGAVWAHFKYENPDPTHGETYVARDTRLGWIVGGGWEYAFAPNWSAKIEYNYMDFGTTTVNLVGPLTSFNESLKDYINEVKVGVNYRFAAPY